MRRQVAHELLVDMALEGHLRVVLPVKVEELLDLGDDFLADSVLSGELRKQQDEVIELLVITAHLEGLVVDKDLDEHAHDVGEDGHAEQHHESYDHLLHNADGLEVSEADGGECCDGEVPDLDHVLGALILFKLVHQVEVLVGVEGAIPIEDINQGDVLPVLDVFDEDVPDDAQEVGGREDDDR